jgi:hypothetical protein
MELISSDATPKPAFRPHPRTENLKAWMEFEIRGSKSNPLQKSGAQSLE